MAIMIRSSVLILCVLMMLRIAAQSDENFDTLEPIVRYSPEINTTDKDLFGYTLVLHQLDITGGVNNTRIVVSAPYGQAPGTQLPRISNDDPTGVIYVCPISPGQCEGLTGDGTGNDRRLFDVDGNINVSILVENSQSEQKRGQFLGSTLKSTGSTFLVCGHRYLNYGAGMDRNPYGTCYISGRSLSNFQRYDPCSTSSRSFFGHGQCQAGTAGDIIDGNILLGAPGTFAWRGAVFRCSSTGERSSSSNGVGSASISWQGYEVITGRIVSQSLDFIVSVPRFNNYKGRVNVYANTFQLRPVGNPPLTGQQTGEYYGYSMAAVDLQGQDMDDLLISAPMYAPSFNRPEYGRVYVYRNSQGALSLFTTLEGRIPFGRFGHAMAKLGDINGDSFEDVAISAPFGDQPGTVYIYAGAGNNILSNDPIQTIVGSSLNLPQLSGLRSFGSSLSSNVDVDNDGYNDLAVGAYLSQKVFLLRTRPVAELKVNLTSDDSIDLTQAPQQCNNQSCFDISSCMTYSGVGLQNTLQISYVLSVNAPSRVRLTQEVGAASTGSISGTLTLMKDQQMCVNTTAILEEEVSINTTAYEVQFIPSLVNARIANPAWDGNMPLSSLESAPVLSVVGDTSVMISVVQGRTLRSLQSKSPRQTISADQQCSTATSCTECLRLSANCVWCAQPNYTTTVNGQNRLRCIRRDADHGCDPSFVEDPTGSASIVMEQPFGGSDFIQVSPQRFQVSLRPGQPQSFTVSVRPANDFPADIYFLMDLSFSMNDDLQSLKTLASQLAAAISNITENFQLGFGSFVDKRRVPYISVETARLSDPCREDGVACQPTYSFHHTLSLTSDANLFDSKIQNEGISGNLDSPEGGFDAMLQVIACQDIIGWRENARRILVYLTDAGFHFAGDGKLGGLITPHDGQCYLEQRGNVIEYTMAETLDYPSVGHISSLLQEFNIIPIFAVESAARPFYESLLQFLDFAFVETLAVDSSNIVDLIRTTYNSISQTMALMPDPLPGVEVEITPMCENIEGSTCTGVSGVSVGQTVSLSITMTAFMCTEELINGRDWRVKIPGFGEFVVNLTGVCDCSCASNPTINSDFCNNGNGTLICGQCDCDQGWVGERCECDSNNANSTVDNCPMGPNGVRCTSFDRGTCVCDICQCNQLDAERKYFGPACECDNFSCDRDGRGLVCGGPFQGICGCGQTCACLPGWTGRACDCSLSNEACIIPSGLICSGQGSCVCGECVCDQDYLFGPFCEICSGNEATGMGPGAFQSTTEPPPQILVHPMDKAISINNDSTSIAFSCMADGSTSYFWQRDTGSIPSSATGINSNRLILNNILPPDSGRYQCLAMNEGGTTNSSYALLTVTALPPLVSVEPTGEVTVEQGENAVFNCLATGVGALNFSYRWFLNNEPVFDQDTQNLIISSVSEGNTGDYTCSVLNPYEAIGRSNNTATLIILERFCNSVTVRYTGFGFNITWNKTLIGVTVEAPCTGPGLNGTISRRCIMDDQWDETINCFREETGILLDRALYLTASLSELNETEIISEAVNIVDSLVNVTFPAEVPILAADINLAVAILSALNNVTEAVISNLTADDLLLEGAASVVNNLLSEANQNNWEQLERTSPATSQNLVRNTERVATLLSATLTNDTTEVIIARPNIVFKAERLNENLDEGYVFPDEDDNLATFTGGSAQVMVPSGLLQDISTNSEELTISSTVISDGTGFRLPPSINGSAAPQVPASAIFSLQIDPLPDPVSLANNPIMIIFDVAVSPVDYLSDQGTAQIQQNFELDDVSCNFYDFSLITDNLQVGGWSTEGVTVDTNNSNLTSVTCLTTHLTSFAVLVSIQDERPPSPADKALSVISYIGCSISLVCLCVSIIILLYTIYKSKDENINHLFIHLNLCSALALGLIVFIAGIESATSNEAACTVVAVLLQYLFISAFCWMLCEGVVLYMLLVTVFGNKLNKRRFFFVLGWGPAIPIVAISAGIAHEHYGTDHYCWITSDDGAIAAFIVPILVIMLINSVFLAITLKVLWGSTQKRNEKVISNANTTKILLKAVIVLLPVLGLTWIFGIIAVNNETQVFAWIFAILNSLQGLFIFIFHVLRNNQVTMEMKDGYNYIKGSAVFKRMFTSSGSTSIFGVSSKASTSQSSSSEVNGHGKILSTSFGGSIAVGDHLSSASEIHLSKDKSEVVIIENDAFEDDNQLKLTAFKKLEESEIKQHSFEVEEKLLVEDNLDVRESITEDQRISITEDVKMCNEVEDAANVVEIKTAAKPISLPGTTK